MPSLQRYMFRTGFRRRLPGSFAVRVEWDEVAVFRSKLLILQGYCDLDMLMLVGFGSSCVAL